LQIRILMIGDVVGRPGRRAVKENIPGLVRDENVDLVIANGENAAGGNGLTREVARELFDAGVDVITTGNHVWNKKETFELLKRESRIVRPGNYPPGAPGAGCGRFKTKSGFNIGVLNLLGRVFMPGLDCPFRKADDLLNELRDWSNIILLDFHAEATSEKMAMAFYLDGKVSAVCGTHTHVQTAAEHILPGGTAYITDVGMTGPRDSVIGVKKEAVVEKFLTQLPRKFEVATGPYQFNAVIVEADTETGMSIGIKRIQNYE